MLQYKCVHNVIISGHFGLRQRKLLSPTAILHWHKSTCLFWGITCYFSYLQYFILTPTVNNKWVTSSNRWNVCLRYIIAFAHLHAYDLDLWPVTLNTFPAMPTHTMITCTKFHWNRSSRYKDIASRKIDVNGWTTHGWTTNNGQTDGRMEDQNTQCLCHLLLGGKA